MKTALPENAKIAKEAKECMQECVSEFISFITSEGMFCLYFNTLHMTFVLIQRTASEKCQQEKRKTVNGEDILFAMTSLGFENYGEALKIYLARYREVSLSCIMSSIAALYLYHVYLLTPPRIWLREANINALAEQAAVAQAQTPPHHLVTKVPTTTSSAIPWILPWKPAPISRMVTQDLASTDILHLTIAIHLRLLLHCVHHLCIIAYYRKSEA